MIFSKISTVCDQLLVHESHMVEIYVGDGVNWYILCMIDMMDLYKILR